MTKAIKYIVQEKFEGIMMDVCTCKSLEIAEYIAKCRKLDYSRDMRILENSEQLRIVYYLSIPET